MNISFSFDDFKKAMNTICDYIEFDNEMSKVFDAYNKKTGNPGEPEFYGTLVGAIADLLTAIMRDEENQWIYYWLFELERGKHYTDGCVKYADGSPIKLETIEDLWNLLCEEIGEMK